MNSCFNLMRRLPLNNMEKNVAGVMQLLNNEDLADEFVQKIDQPLCKLLLSHYLWSFLTLLLV